MTGTPERTVAQRWYADRRAEIATAGESRLVLARVLEALGADPSEERPTIVNLPATTGELNLRPPANHTHYKVRLAKWLSRILNTHIGSTRIIIHSSHGFAITITK